MLFLFLACAISCSMTAAEDNVFKNAIQEALAISKKLSEGDQKIDMTASIIGSGKRSVKLWSLEETPFTSIDADGDALISLQMGKRNEIVMGCDDNQEKYVSAKVTDGQLRFRQKANLRALEPDRAPLTYILYLRDTARASLVSIVAKGKSRIWVEAPLVVPNLVLANDGAGELLIKDSLRVAGLLTIRLTGAGALQINKASYALRTIALNLTKNPTSLSDCYCKQYNCYAAPSGKKLYSTSNVHIKKSIRTSDCAIVESESMRSVPSLT